MASGYTSWHGRSPLDRPHGMGDHLMGTPQGNTPRLLGKPCLWSNLMGEPEGHTRLRGVWEHLMAWEHSSWLSRKDSGSTSRETCLSMEYGRTSWVSRKESRYTSWIAPRAYGATSRESSQSLWNSPAGESHAYWEQSSQRNNQVGAPPYG